MLYEVITGADLPVEAHGGDDGFHRATRSSDEGPGQLGGGELVGGQVGGASSPVSRKSFHNMAQNPCTAPTGSPSEGRVSGGSA